MTTPFLDSAGVDLNTAIPWPEHFRSNYVKSYASAKEHGVLTLGDLMQASEEQLRAITGVGDYVYSAARNWQARTIAAQQLAAAAAQTQQKIEKYANELTIDWAKVESKCEAGDRDPIEYALGLVADGLRTALGFDTRDRSNKTCFALMDAVQAFSKLTTDERLRKATSEAALYKIQDALVVYVRTNRGTEDGEIALEKAMFSIDAALQSLDERRLLSLSAYMFERALRVIETANDSPTPILGQMLAESDSVSLK